MGDVLGVFCLVRRDRNTIRAQSPCMTSSRCGENVDLEIQPNPAFMTSVPAPLCSTHYRCLLIIIHFT